MAQNGSTTADEYLSTCEPLPINNQLNSLVHTDVRGIVHIDSHLIIVHNKNDFVLTKTCVT